MNRFMEKFKMSDKSCSFYASRDLRDKAEREFGEDAEVVAFAYTNYGGTFMDRAWIEFYKERYPDKICWEKTSWNGQNAVCIPIEGMDGRDWFYDVDGFDDFYYEFERNLMSEAAASYCEMNHCEYLRSEVEDFLESNGRPEPNAWDYLESDLDKHIAPMMAEETPGFVKCVLMADTVAELRDDMKEFERRKMMAEVYDPIKAEVISEAIGMLDKLLSNYR